MFLSSTRPETKHGRTGLATLFARPFGIQESVHATKENSVFQWRSPAVFHLSWFVPCDEQLPGSTGTEQFDSHKHWSDHHRMNPIDSDSVDGMEIRQGLASRATEGNVPPDLLYRAARFNSSDYISSRQMLVLKTYVRLRKNSYIVQAAQRSRR
jgi:hypothetical protein